MRTLLLGLSTSLLLFTQQVSAQTPVVTGARMTWYGNYAAGKTTVVKDPASVTGTKVISSAISPPSTNTDRIPLVSDGRFGFGYELIGGPANAQVALKYITKFPPPGVRDAATGQLKLVKQNTYRDLAIGRKDLFCGEYLGEFKDPPAGTWTLQVWYGDRMLLEKSFAVGNR
jgi:hypothetical protein